MRNVSFADLWEKQLGGKSSLNAVDSAAFPEFLASEEQFEISIHAGEHFEINRFLFGLLLALPPWWQTWFVYLCCIMIVGGLVYLQIRLLQIRAALKKESALHEAKIDFFANVSHDARAHLSLIEGRLEKAFRLLDDDQAAKHHLGHARNNSHQLIQLLNELLDYHKMENGSIQLSVYKYDLTKTIETILSSFELVGTEKRITTRFIHPDSPVNVWFDLRQMQKVFNNLLANAYKFTPEHGWVTVEITQTQDRVIASVTNSGLGISTKDIGRLFDKFFQGNNDDSPEGHGIGLALSKTIVDLHSAKISVTSQQRSEGQDGQTRFSVGFLSGSSHYSSDQFAKSEAVFTDYAGVDVGAIYGLAPLEKSFTVLLIEDNDELRAVESELLSVNYHVMEAVNGSDGLKMAFENIPDLILCDVILPEQNGIQICSQLKADVRTSHIPIILLTGQSALPQVIQGLQAGADDYLVHPVDVSILLLKIQNLIKTRTAIRDYTGRTLSSAADEWLIAGANDEFIDKLRSLVIENISQPNFGVNEMAFQVGMGVSVLYRKVRSLTGLTVNDFMKAIKMQKALQLLESGTYQVSEVALMVGYESVRYFSNEFKKLYGKNPSKFRSQSAE
ncbi:Histidine kinase-, DNA gyrase B-, and HSP90-like ATPase [Dyadobacter sp. SG02]|nr:Histidine kinase-, DNA gyrase B-, and HSP90-like ATPase [Dyadobacter sp. SG02]